MNRSTVIRAEASQGKMKIKRLRLFSKVRRNSLKNRKQIW